MNLRIGLAVPAPVPVDVQAAILRLARVCDVSDLADGEPIDAVLRPQDSPAPADERTIRLVTSAERVVAEADAYITVDAGVQRLRELVAGTGLVVAVPEREPYPGALPVAPFTRARIRRARGLSPVSVARARGKEVTWEGTRIPRGAVATALALCSVADVDSEDFAVQAAAWGAPVVTTWEVRDRTGLPHMPDGMDSVEALLADEASCTAHAWACRTWYERERSPRWAVRLLAQAVRARTANPWDSRCSDVLDQLGAPQSAMIRDRVFAATAPLRSRG